MTTAFALLRLAMLFVSTLLMDGSPRYFDVSPKEGNAELVVTLDAQALYDSGKANTFIWTLGNGETLTTTHPIFKYTYNQPGTFTVNLDYQYVEIDKKGRVKIKHQKDGGSVKIVVHPKPNVAPIAMLDCFAPDFLKLTCNPEGSKDSDGTIVSFKYEWGDDTHSINSDNSSATHIYQTSGEKLIRLTVTDNDGATHSVEKSFFIKENSKPAASFECVKAGFLSISCNSTSTDPDEELSQFEWTLDDGTTYSTKSFSHTFNKRPGDVALTSHNVSLKVTDSLGLTDSTAKDVEVDLEPIKEAPRGYFKAFIDGTHLNLRAFIAKTQFNTKKAFYQIFDSQNNLLHTLPLSEFYQNTLARVNLENYANYRVVLTIIDYRDQVASTTRQVQLVEDTSSLQPFVNFRAIQSNIRTVYLNLNQSFDYDENYSINEFIINLGNGEVKSLKTDTFLTYTYAEAGTYDISVTAKTNHGTEKTITQAITVTDEQVAPIKPDPTFAYRIYSFAQNVSFYNEKSGTPNGEIISYLWDFGDGTSAYGETQAHFYLPGEYIVTLTVVDTAGYSNTQTQKVTIINTGDDIVANIDCNQRQPYLDITQMCKVNALDKYNEVSRVRVVWGDGTVFTLAAPFDQRQGIYYPQKKYAAEGTYPIRLIVNTLRGDFKTHDISRTIIARRPVANIQCSVNNLLVFCDGLGSYDPKGLALTYTFNFGDGHIVTNTTGVISYSYPQAGLYNVTLKIEDPTGLSAQSSFQVQPVEPPNQLPVAKFNCDSPEPNTVYCWDDGSYDPDGSLSISKLAFDDGGFDFLNKENPTRHQFISGGQHEITLTVVDDDGGSTSLTKKFEVKSNNEPVASFECDSPSSHRLNCWTQSYDSDVNDMITSYSWKVTFNDTEELKLEGNLQAGFDHTFNHDGDVLVEHSVSDKYGATQLVTKVVTLKKNNNPISNINCFLTNGRTYQCNSNASDPDGHSLNFEWMVEGSKFTGENLLYNFTDGGQKTINLKVIDTFGAEFTASTTISIEGPAIGLICSVTGPLNIHCDASETETLNQYKITYYRFEFDQDDLVENKVVDYEFKTLGQHKVKLLVGTEFGEVVTREQEFNFTSQYLAPKADFKYEPGLSFRTIFDSSISLSQERKVNKYSWNFGDGSELSTSSSPTHTFPGEGYYNVILVVEDETGATDSITRRIYIPNIEVPDPGPAVDDTLLGIDTDMNGVRDDVQNWILLEAKDNANLKSLMMKMAKYYQSNFTNVNDELKIRETAKKQEYASICLSSLVEESKVVEIESSFKLFHFNTEERVKALTPILQAQAGMLSESSADMVNPQDYCLRVD